MGRWDETIAAFEAAERLAAKSFWGVAFWLLRGSIAHCHAGRFEQALDASLTRRSFFCLTGRSELLGLHRIVCSRPGRPREGEARAAVRYLRDTEPELT